jgi:hypothetical protein
LGGEDRDGAVCFSNISDSSLRAVREAVDKETDGSKHAPGAGEHIGVDGGVDRVVALKRLRWEREVLDHPKSGLSNFWHKGEGRALEWADKRLHFFL